MTKPKKKQNKVLSNREKALLIISVIVIVISIPLTYVFFLLPLLLLPIAGLAGLVVADIIRNPIVVKIMQILTILGAALSIWLVSILLSWQTQ